MNLILTQAKSHKMTQIQGIPYYLNDSYNVGLSEKNDAKLRELV